MALRARKPETVEKRLKLFLFGEHKVGKTIAALQFPQAYLVDTEHGAEEKQYVAAMLKAGSVYFASNDGDEIMTELRALHTDKHQHRTLIIDPITTVYDDMLERAEAKVGTEFGRHYGVANTAMKRMMNLIMRLDMNVIMTAYAKTEYGQNLAKLGTTFDGWKRLPYIFDLILWMEARPTETPTAPRRVVTVKGSRIEAFPLGDCFDWTYAEFNRRYGGANLEREHKPEALATPEQIAELVRLLAVVNLPEGTPDKWLAKAGVDRFEDMPAAACAACIQYTNKLIGKKNGAS